jgi:hypothetical protein
MKVVAAEKDIGKAAFDACHVYGETTGCNSDEPSGKIEPECTTY